MSNLNEINRNAKSGGSWIMVTSAFSQLIRLGSNIALAALLYEEAFALMALVTAVMMGLAMFSDLGLGHNVIQSPRGNEPAFLNTAWTLQVIRGALLALIGSLLAWPVATFYGANDPAAMALLWLIPIVSMTALIDGLRSPRVMTAGRTMELAKLARIEMIVTGANAAFMVGLAWYTRSVYALAITAVLSSLLHAVLTYWWLPGPPARFVLDREAVRSIVAFGKWIFVATICSFFAMQIDRLAFSAMYPLVEVGVYSIAASLTLTVTTLVGRLQGSIMFPWYSRVLEQKMALPQAFERGAYPVLVMATFLCSLLLVGASSFFALAYDDRYFQAAAYVPILAIGVWFSSIGGMYGSVFLALGHSRWIALVSATKVVSFSILLFGVSFFDISLTGAAFVVLASETITVALSRYLGWRLGIRQVRHELVMLGLLGVAAGIGLLVSLRFKDLAFVHPVGQLALLGMVVLLMFLPFATPLLKLYFKRPGDAVSQPSP